MFDKLLLHITDECLSAYRWRKGGLSRLDAFRVDDDRRDAERFGALVKAFRNVPAVALVDVVEEDFQRGTLPHVRGAARARLTERNLQRLYRDTPYRRCDHQGRQTEGRRDAVVLYSAITRPRLAQMWLRELTRHQVPLCSLHSPAHLSEWVAKRLDIRAGQILLVSHHASGIRQTFLQGGRLRFSRLVVSRSEDPAALAALIGEEIARTHTYLLNDRLLARDGTLEVVTLADAAILDAIVAPADTPLLRHRAVDFDAALRTGRLAHPGDGCVGDAVFLNALAHAAGGYPLASSERRHGALLRARRAMLAASLAVAVGSALLTADNLFELRLMRQEGKPLVVLENTHRSRHHELRARAPATPVPAEVMRSVVELHASINRDGPDMDYLLYVVSNALERTPAIELTRLVWEAGGEIPERGWDVAGPTASSDGVRGPFVLGLEQPVGALLRIDARVRSADRGYRPTVDAVRGFVAMFEAVRDIRIHQVREPLDLAPAGHLRVNGQGDDQQGGAFSLTVLYVPALPS